MPVISRDSSHGWNWYFAGFERFWMYCQVYKVATLENFMDSSNCTLSSRTTTHLLIPCFLGSGNNLFLWLNLGWLCDFNKRVQWKRLSQHIWWSPKRLWSFCFLSVGVLTGRALSPRGLPLECNCQAWRRPRKFHREAPMEMTATCSASWYPAQWSQWVNTA